MRILYGVQTTGRGHLVRARAMVRELKARGHEIRTVLSGPSIEPHWLGDTFEPWTHLRGLTHVSVGGRISYWQTTRQLKPLEFLRDVRTLDPGDAELVVSDYEPITARVARRAGLPSIGIGHLYAFAHKSVPVHGKNVFNRAIMRGFAPVRTPLGLHWHHFDAPVLPPTIPADVPDPATVTHDGPVLVYLSFESFEHVIGVLREVNHAQFRVYSPNATAERLDNVDVRPISREAFLADLARASGVICNTGFSLTSEALHLGKRVLTKPTYHQTEQESNALALRDLGLATVTDRIEAGVVREWLADERRPAPAHYPDVMTAVVDWIEQRAWDDVRPLAESLWARVGGVGGTQRAAAH